MKANQQGATYGGRKEQERVRCGNCGHEVVVADPQFVSRGPIRCGACGQEIGRSGLRRSRIQDALGGSDPGSGRGHGS